MTSLPEVPTDELLNFQEFSTSNKHQNVGFDNQIQIDIKPKESDTFDKEPIISGKGGDSNSKAFWTFEYYQQFFDVDTDEIVQRLLASINPRDALGTKLENKPDLYGPFWVSMTLIFTIAISGNVAKYLHERNVHYHWKYNFHLVTYAATAIICYICLIPIAIWSLLKWSITSNVGEQSNVIPSILKILCLYGYSLFIYIPVSILWTIQIQWLRWLLVVFATILSVSVLLIALYPSLRLSRHKIFFAIGIVVCHFLLALSFMLYFFHLPDHQMESPVIKAVTESAHPKLVTKTNM